MIERDKAVKHILLDLKLFRMQMHAGNYLLTERPAYADSWKIPEVADFPRPGGGDLVVAEPCMYGLKTRGSADGEELPAKKPIRFVSNSWSVLQELSTRCDKTHEHQQLMGGRAARAAEYPDELCEVFCRGIANQLMYDRTGRVPSQQVLSTCKALVWCEDTRLSSLVTIHTPLSRCFLPVKL